MGEIQLMEKDSQSKSNSNSLKRIESKRPSKKSKQYPQMEDNIADEKPTVPVKLTVNFGGVQEPADESWMSEEIQCLVEEPTSEEQTKEQIKKKEKYVIQKDSTSCTLEKLAKQIDLKPIERKTT